jgi:hypothetical protein
MPSIAALLPPTRLIYRNARFIVKFRVKRAESHARLDEFAA